MRSTLVPVAEMNLGGMLAKELICFIQELEGHQTRSLQTAIGPSEIGLPCRRRLIKKLLATRDPPQSERWLATIGVAVHKWLADGFEHEEYRRTFLSGRFGNSLVEGPVNVGSIGGVDICGHSDLYDVETGTVIDWKVVGNTRLDIYRRHGPGQQYRIQAHLYGRGFARMGLPVRQVLIMFLPRNKALTNYHPWFEPYDESVALAALSRAEGLLQIGQQFPWPVIEQLYPACQDEWCPWCPVRRPYGNRPSGELPTLRQAIAAR